MSDNLSLFNLFIEETKEHLDNINECLLELEKDPGDIDRINGLFRSVHTIKGSTASMQYTKTSELIHRMEDMIQSIRDGKMSVNEKIIQLLFVTHDYLEDFIEKVSNGDGEENLRSSHIYEELCNILGNCSIEKPVAKPEKKSDGNRMRIADEEMQKIILDVERGSGLYGVHVKIDPDAVFPSITAWMVFQEMEQHCRIAVSAPVKPTEEEFKDGTFDVDNGCLDMIILTEKDKESLLAVLENQLQDVSRVCVNELKLNNGALLGDFISWNEFEGTYTFNHDLNECGIPQASMEVQQDSMECYSPEFIFEISMNIKNAEIEFLGACSSAEPDPEKLSGLYRLFHIVTGLSGYIGHNHIYDISKGTERIIDLCRKRRLELDDFTINLIMKSVALIRELAEGSVKDKEESFYDEIQKHILLLKSDAPRNGVSDAKDNDFSSGGLDENNRLGEILVDQGKIDSKTLEDMVQLQRESGHNLKLGQLLVKGEKLPLEDVHAAITMQDKARSEVKNVNLIRIPEFKVDNLVDMLGELIILQSLHKEDVGAALSGGDVNRLYNNIARMERITKELQGISMSLRMVSLKQTFQKMLRIGRDTSKELNRNVDFEVFGDETEIDRGVVEKVHDPLMHIVRNAVSHGIEPAQEREAAGKPAEGHVRLIAYNKKGNIHIEVSDDGKGLNLERILQKAVEKNLAQEGRSYSENEIISFIFLPGFSTQEQADNISGRGVGMNVVEAEMKKIGGKIEVRNTKGKGSAFILKIPVNLATINGTVIEVLNERYILPTVNVKRIFKPENTDWVSVKGSDEMIRNRGDLIRLIKIEQILGIPVEKGLYKGNVAVVLEHDGELRALPVDSVLGKQEIVIKPLESEFQKLGFLSGATILGDGRVSFILDVESFFARTNS